MKLIVTGGAGFIGANFVHYTLQNKPNYGSYSASVSVLLLVTG
jgi:dTDP-D-glucose 4,6-dehydratase